MAIRLKEYLLESMENIIYYFIFVYVCVADICNSMFLLSQTIFFVSKLSWVNSER